MKSPVPLLPSLATILLAGMVMQSSAFAQSGASSIIELANQSDVVIVGKVSTLNSEWSADRSRIQTRVVVSVSQVLKGAGTGAAVTIVTPGGEVDGVGELYSEMPSFKSEEDVLLFARRDSHGDLRVTAGQEGKVSLHKDEISGKMMAAGKESLDDISATLRKSVQNQLQK